VSPLRLYFRFAAASLRAQAQYRVSFAIWSIAQFIGVGVEFLAVWVLLDRFGAIRGWSLPELSILFAIVNIAFAVAESFGRGFDMFPNVVKNGDFDRLLLRPLSTAFQVSCREFQFLRVGRLCLGVVLFVWGAASSGVTFGAAKLALVAGAITGGACVFYGLFILQATMSFWTIESLEIINALTYGGTETAQYPLSFYRPWFRRFFTFVVPLAFVSYIPAGVLLGRETTPALPEAMRWCSPLVGVAFLAITLLIWRFGERRYVSTGS
jgi:ABC-2 type transport system permease protein